MNTALDDNRIVIIETDNLDQAQHGYGAFYVKDRSLVYCTGDGMDIEAPTGKKLVGAREHFMRKILREAMCGLDAYLLGRMGDREMYGTEHFWRDALKHAGRTIVPNALWIDYRGVPYGYLVLHTGDWAIAGNPFATAMWTAQSCRRVMAASSRRRRWSCVITACSTRCSRSGTPGQARPPKRTRR